MFFQYIFIELSESNGNFVVINGFHLPLRLESKVVDVNSLQHFSAPLLSELFLSSSNINRLSKIFHGNLPALEILDLTNCNGIIASDIITLKGVFGLSNGSFFLIRLHREDYSPGENHFLS